MFLTLKTILAPLSFFKDIMRPLILLSVLLRGVFCILPMWCWLSAYLHAQQTRASQPCIPTTETGTLRFIAEFPARHILPRAVSIWLPPGYTPDKQYPVLYMHDGQNIFDSACAFGHVAWEVDSIMTDLIKRRRIRECIVVGIHNTTLRFTEYMPQKPFFSTTTNEQTALLSHRNFAEKPIQSDAYLQWIVHELKPFIDSTVATHRSREHTFIAGSSMGGLISLYALCEYPQVFGGAACLSTHWSVSLNDSTPAFPKALHRYISEQLPSVRSGHRLYFDYGTATLDRFYPKYQIITDSIMRKRGYTAKQWITKEFRGAEHNERAWKVRFAEPLQFLLRR